MRRLLLTIALLAGNGPVPAAQVLEFDAVRSRANFEVKVLYLIGVHGEFGTVHGTLSIDHARATASVDALIDTNAVHMRNRHYENWTKSAEFFDAQHFPQIHFVSAPFPLTRLRAGGEIDGVLTVRGVNRPVVFTIDPSVCAQPLGGECAVAANGAIHRSEFGMHSRRGTLADKVELRLSIVVRPPPS